MSHEHEAKLAEFEKTLTRAHQLEVEQIRAEEMTKQLREKSVLESKYHELEKLHTTKIHELELHHTDRMQSLRDTVETAKKSYEEKRGLVESQFKEVLRRVDKQNKEIESRTRSHRETVASLEAAHREDLRRKDVQMEELRNQIRELNDQLKSSNAIVRDSMETMTTAQEVAAVVILMRKTCRSRGTEDFSSSELKSYLAAGSSSGRGHSGTHRENEVIVPSAQLEAAYVASKVVNLYHLFAYL